MKVVHDEKQDTLTGKVSAVFLTKTSNELPDDDAIFSFSLKIRSIVGMCSNIHGLRTSNMCSHQMVSLLYYHKIFTGTNIQVATPRVSKQFKNVKNIATWVQKLSDKSIQEQINYIDRAYNNEYEFDSSNSDNVLEIYDDESDVVF